MCFLVTPGLQVHLPCGGHHRAPSGQGSPCGFDGGSWGERGRRGSARGCWRTERTASQPDCPLSGETLRHRSETHAHTWSSGKTVLVWSLGPDSVLDRECEENACLLRVCAHPTDSVLDDRQKTRVGVTGWRTDEEIARRKRETAELDSEGRGNQVEPEIN